MIDSLIISFWSDPFKVLLGSSGFLGLVVLGMKWWNARARPRVRLLGHTYEPNGTYECPTEIRVEIENLGREPTSLDATVSMRCLYPKGATIQAEFKIQESDRMLPPVVPRTFVLLGKPPVGFIFSHFRHYRFRFTRGGTVSLLVLNASGGTAGPLKFTALKWLYLLTGALPHVEG